MKFKSAEALLAWIVRNWHYVPGDPLAAMIMQFFEDHELMPCGHPPSAVVSSDEGTQNCLMCIQEANHAA